MRVCNFKYQRWYNFWSTRSIIFVVIQESYETILFCDEPIIIVKIQIYDWLVLFFVAKLFCI